MNKDSIIHNGVLPALRIIIIEAEELCYWDMYQKSDLVIKNLDNSFDLHYADLMPPNLDMLHLFGKKKLKIKELNGEYYSDDFVNVVFKKQLRVDEKNKRVTKK